MGDMLTKKPFSKRAFVSIAMLVSGLCLPFSGIKNHKLQFEAFTTERHFWMAVHNIAGILFVFFAFLHAYYHRRALINYMKRTKYLFISKEALAALVLVMAIVGLFASHAFLVK